MSSSWSCRIFSSAYTPYHLDQYRRIRGRSSATYRENLGHILFIATLCIRFACCDPALLSTDSISTGHFFRTVVYGFGLRLVSRYSHFDLTPSRYPTGFRIQEQLLIDHGDLGGSLARLCETSCIMVNAPARFDAWSYLHLLHV